VIIGDQGKLPTGQPIEGDTTVVGQLQVGQLVLVRPDMEWCLNQIREKNEVNLTKKPWMARVVAEPDYDQQEVLVQYYQPASARGTLHTIWRESTEPQITIKLASIYYWGFAFNGEKPGVRGGKWPKKAKDAAIAEMVSLQDELVEQAAVKLGIILSPSDDT